MSKAEHWFPLYVGDYLSDTGHLSTSEHGAYLLLLMHQWRHGCVPSDEKQLSKITRQPLHDWRRMSETILAFFAMEEGGAAYVQGRLERERAKADEYAARRTEKARKAATSRWKADAPSNAPSMPVASSEHVPSNAWRCPTQPQPQEDTSLRSVSLSRASRTTHPDFADFWAAYPRKAGKGAAEKAFAAAIAKGATVAEIAAGLNRQAWPADPQFIPHPATWLNQRRWQDDPAAAAPPRQQSERAGKMDWLIRDIQRERDAAEEFPDFAKGLLQ
jgi:uncharacterized protein YdaU (DUF1376 family)